MTKFVGKERGVMDANHYPSQAGVPSTCHESNGGARHDLGVARSSPMDHGHLTLLQRTSHTWFNRTSSPSDSYKTKTAIPPPKKFFFFLTQCLLSEAWFRA